MSRATTNVGVTCLKLLLLGLCAVQRCSAAFEDCKPDNYSQERNNIIGDPRWADSDLHPVSCNASSWIIDGKTGSLGIFFKLPKPGYLTKQLTLLKWNLKKKDWDIYSEEFFIPEKCNETDDLSSYNTTLFPFDVNECGYHTFGYISSGIYRLEYCPNIESAKRNITTEVDESTLTCNAKDSAALSSWSDHGGQLFATWQFPYQEQQTQKMSRNYRLRNSSQDVIRSWWVRARKKDNDPLICESNDSGLKVEPNVDVANHEQKFLIEHLEPGNYTILIDSFGQFSLMTAIKKCTTITVHFEVPVNEEHRPSEAPPTKGKVVVYSMIGSLAFLVVCIFSCIIYLIFRPSPSIRDVYIPDEEKADLTKRKILLLYARDCPQFNDLMAAFRDFLKNSNFEVFDCYDPGRSRRIDENPTLWMRSLVNDTEVRILVVSSRCARLQQLAFINRRMFTYQKPQHLDQLFFKGLCDVMNIHRHVYLRIFNIVLQEFTDKEDMLSLGESRTYTLPIHIQLLIRDLRNNSSISEETDDLRRHVSTLKVKLDILARHKNTNRDYIRNIISQS